MTEPITFPIAHECRVIKNTVVSLIQTLKVPDWNSMIVNAKLSLLNNKMILPSSSDEWLGIKILITWFLAKWGLYSGLAEIVWLLWLPFESTLEHHLPWWTLMLQQKQLWFLPRGAFIGAIMATALLNSIHPIFHNIYNCHPSHGLRLLGPLSASAISNHVEYPLANS